MQNYPSYSMNGYNPYQMPMYQQHMMQQPYMDRMAQLQSIQQSLQPQIPQNTVPALSGRIVDDFNAITANDVPMDGNGAIFIKSDGSEIQVRSWTAQGTISTSRFKPYSDAQVGNSTQTSETLSEQANTAFGEAFMRRFDDMEQRFDKLEKALIKKNKREVISDDE